MKIARSNVIIYYFYIPLKVNRGNENNGVLDESHIHLH